MSRIKSKDTQPELLVRRYIYSAGIRFRIHYKLPGSPDIVIPHKKFVIFINGCFWHMHKNCVNYVEPKTNTKFWKEKIRGNVIRDERNYIKLSETGWKKIIIWECEIEKDLNHIMNALVNEIKSK